MRVKPESLFSLMVAAAAAAALVLTAPWSIKTALYPRTIAVPLLVLALTEFVFSLRARPAADAVHAMDFKLSEGVDPKVALQRTLSIFAWIFGFFAAIVLLGFPIAVPVFVFAYLRGAARAPWVLTVGLVAVAWAVFNGLFVRLLHLPFPPGLLLRALQ